MLTAVTSLVVLLFTTLARYIGKRKGEMSFKNIVGLKKIQNEIRA